MPDNQHYPTNGRNERWDDRLPPGGWVCATCGVPVESEPCPSHGVGDKRPAQSCIVPHCSQPRHHHGSCDPLDRDEFHPCCLDTASVLAGAFHEIGRTSADAGKLITVADACTWAAETIMETIKDA